MNIIKGLKEFRKTNRLKQKTIAEYLEVTRSYVSGWENHTHTVSPLLFVKLMENDQGWDTSMLSFVNTNNKTEDEIIAEYGGTLPSRTEITPSITIPIIPQSVLMQSKTDIMEWLADNASTTSTINLGDLVKNSTVCLQMDNNAMFPMIEKGDLVFLQKIDTDAVIANGQIYAINTKTNGLLIRIATESDGIITCSANTSEYLDFKINRADVINMFCIVGVFRSLVVPTKDSSSDLVEQLRTKDEQINKLMAQIEMLLKIATK